MTTFDLAEVRNFAVDLESRLNRCDNGEGMECASLDDTLRHYASLCCEFRECVRHWGRAVFAGRVAFDPAVEQIWQTEGVRLYSRAVEMLAYGQQAEVPCYMLDAQAILQSALFDLDQLLRKWVTPQLAVGPAARQKLEATPSTSEEVQRRIQSLPPLPAEWQPADPKQQSQFRRLRRKRSS